MTSAGVAEQSPNKFSAKHHVTTGVLIRIRPLDAKPTASRAWLPRAIACNAPRHRWHRRQPWHPGICNLQNLQERSESESHSFRRILSCRFTIHALHGVPTVQSPSILATDISSSRNLRGWRRRELTLLQVGQPRSRDPKRDPLRPHVRDPSGGRQLFLVPRRRATNGQRPVLERESFHATELGGVVRH